MIYTFDFRLKLCPTTGWNAPNGYIYKSCYITVFSHALTIYDHQNRMKAMKREERYVDKLLRCHLLSLHDHALDTFMAIAPRPSTL